MFVGGNVDVMDWDGCFVGCVYTQGMGGKSRLNIYINTIVLNGNIYVLFLKLN